MIAVKNVRDQIDLDEVEAVRKSERAGRKSLPPKTRNK